MNDLEIWLLAASLAIDCFTVSIASGIIMKKVYWHTFLRISLLFGIFQAIMPFIGWLGTNSLHKEIEAYDHWITFGLLSFIGLKMINDYFSHKDECKFNPNKLKVVLMLAVATSIDAFAVGISFTLTGFNTINSLLYPIFAIGITSFILSIIGCLAGVFFGKKIKIRMEPIGGIILICIGVKILIEHLGTS